MNPWLMLALNALAVVLTGGMATLTSYQVSHAWEPALVIGGVVAGGAGLAQLAKYGITVGPLGGTGKGA